MEQSPRNFSSPKDAVAPDQLDWAFGFALFHLLVWGLLTAAVVEWADPEVLWIASIPVLYGAVAWGLHLRSRWGWWLAIAGFGLPCLAANFAFLSVVADRLEARAFDDVLWIGLWATGVAVLFGIPMICLLTGFRGVRRSS